MLHNNWVAGIFLTTALAFFSGMLVTDEITEVVKRALRFADGVANRCGIEERLHAEIERAARGNSRIEAVNDTRGNIRRDGLPLEITACITSMMRSYDVCGRLGGDEFMLLFPGFRRTGGAAIVLADFAAQAGWGRGAGM